MLVCLLLVLILSPPQVEPFLTFGNIARLATFAYDIFSRINEIDDTVDKFGGSDSIGEALDKITDLITDVSKSIKSMESRVTNELADIKRLVSGLRLGNQIDTDMNTLAAEIIKIDGFYVDFTNYGQNLSQWNPKTLDTFSSQAIAPAGGLLESLRLIHALIVPGTKQSIKKSLILLLSEEVKNNIAHSCNDMLPQQRFLDLYSAIILIEMKAYVTLSFSYILQESLGHGSFIAEVKNREKQFEVRVEQSARIFKEAMAQLPRTFRRCDPASHIRGETFYEFERFINGYVIQQDAIEGKAHDKGCMQDCESMGKVLHRNETSTCEGIECQSTPQSCAGTIAGCGWGGDMDICPSEANSSRRYEWFKMKGVVYGVEGKCKEEMLHPKQIMGPWLYGYPTFYCYVCRCLCFDDNHASKSTHSVSVRDVLSNIDDNMVVTGIRFVIQNNILQIQIQQGKLAESGTIEPGSDTWKEPESLSLDEEKSRDQGKHVFSLMSGDASVEELEDTAKHIAVLTFEERTLNLDELKAPNDHLVTGVRFTRVTGEGNNKAPIQLEIQVTPFDFDEGKLKDNSVWITPKDMKQGGERAEVQHAEENKNPLDSKETKPMTGTTRWMRLSRSGWVASAGQMVIPLLDALGSAASSPAPLAGIRLLHKAEKGYAGFLSWEITSIDMSQSINLENPGRQE